MSGPAALLELSMPGANGPLRFTFATGGERDHIASFVRANGLAAYEAPTPALLAGLIGEAPDLVLDVGANTGIFTLLAAAANTAVRVCAFEPLDSARALLEANVACNPDLAGRIAISASALSSVQGAMPFFETINDQGLISTSSSLELQHAIGVGVHRQRQVCAETLDAWADSSGQRPIQLMKIDVEGHEHAVLQGGRRAIGRDRPLLVVEMLGGAAFAAVNAVLDDFDYLDFALAPDGLRGRRSACFHADAWNHLFCPREKLGLVTAVCRRLDLRLDPA